MRTCLAVFATLFALTLTATAAEKTPNIVLIFTDDQGYQDIGCFGSPDIATPALDKMATEGMRFTDFYSAAPVCSASRAALLTGRYCVRTGVTGVFFPRHKNGLPVDEITFAEVLKQKNYATACIGKWHLGHVEKHLPMNQGFDSYYGVPYSNDMTVDPAMSFADEVVLRQGVTKDDLKDLKPKRNLVPLVRGTEVIEYPVDQATLTKRCTEEAIEFITANKERPFFLYMPHTMPHVPLFASEDFLGKSKRGLYGDVIEEIDWSVGQVLDTLKELDLDDNTVVIFTSDNGPWLSKGKNGGSALPLRSGKFSVFEGGMRVPTIAWGPGRVPAGTTCSEVAATIDMLPTFADLAGAKVPVDRPIDGRSIVPLLEGREGAISPHEAYFFRGQAVRAGKWKFHAKGKTLYDLSVDIGEKDNVAGDHPDVVERMTKLLDEHRERVKKK